MGIPVVIKASGGLPVTVVSNGYGTPMEVAANGYGLAVTQVANGLPVVGIAAGGTSAEVSQFLSRTSGLDAPHTAAYTALIDGLVADGVWTKIDLLATFASQNETNALLNIKNGTYTVSKVSTPAFTADRGYTLNEGVAYLTTNFNASTAGANYQQNSAHLATWTVTAAGNWGATIGTLTGGSRQYLLPNYAGGGTTYYRINTSDGTNAAASGIGLTTAVRTSSSEITGHWNGTLMVTDPSDTSAALNNAVFTLGDQATGIPDVGSQIAACSIGGALTAANVTALYNRLRAYLTAVGVP